jgi:hypothetical protein
LMLILQIINKSRIKAETYNYIVLNVSE